MTTVFTNATVFTGREHNPIHEAVAIDAGRILAVGDHDTVLEAAGGSAEVIDLAGGFVGPGFVEAHTHMMMLGQTLDKVELRGCGNLGEIQERLLKRRREQPEAAFILGAGWMFDAVPGDRPTAAMLDEIIDDIPVLLDSNDVHSAWANTAAMNAMGIDSETQNPTGGEIVRGETGAATGFLLETAAIEYAWSFLETITNDADRDRFLDSAFRVYIDNGVTAASDMAVGEAEAAAFRRRLDRDGCLPFPVTGYWLIRPTGEPERDLESVARAVEVRDMFAQGPGAEYFRIIGVKLILDGVIDACTASMREPYADGSHAEAIWTFGSAAPVAVAADSHGLELAMHAIGDHASEIALDLVEECVRVNGARTRTARIEHLESVTDETIERMAELDVIASMQPVHCDPAIMANWMAVLGNGRAETGFPWHKFRDAAVTLALGTDAPTAPHLTSHNLFIAMTTRSALTPGSETYHPERAFGVGQALEALTRNPARAGLCGAGIGEIVAGEPANLVVLDVDPFVEDSERLLDAAVLTTIINGASAYLRPEAARQI
ncbi:MAG: amidohydrolase [Brevibacterium sp.]|uniref:amidohydrolase n=1 Tax=Brevibacterium sp. TaxID=1701 RepID=UPI003F90ADC8